MAENSGFKSGLNFLSRQADRVVSPEARNEAHQKINRFAHDQPLAFAFIVLGLAVSGLPILTAATLGLVATACFWSLLVCLTMIFLSPALLSMAVIAATIWLSYTTVRWSADMFAKVPVGSGNESNQVLMKPEAEANGNEAHAKLELNLFKVEEKGDDGRM